MNSSCGAKAALAILFGLRSEACDSDPDSRRVVLRDLATREINAFLWVALIAITALLLARVVKVFCLWAKAMSIPGPPCPSFYGHHKLLSRGNFTEVLSELHKKYGSVVKVWLSPTKLLVSIKDPTLIKQTLLKFLSPGAAENLVNPGESGIDQKFVTEGVETLFTPLLERYEENDIMVNLAGALENEGISSFRFDFAGNGESEGIFQYGNYRREADDLYSVIQHFSGENRVASAIVGHSKGGDVVLLYASKYQDIRTVANVSGRYDLKRGIEERLGKDFMEVIKKEGSIDVKNKTGSVSYRVEDMDMEVLPSMWPEVLKLIPRSNST